MDINIFRRKQKPLDTHPVVTDPQVTDRVLPVSSVRQIPHLNDVALQEEGKNEQTIKEATKKEEDKQAFAAARLDSTAASHFALHIPFLSSRSSCSL